MKDPESVLDRGLLRWPGIDLAEKVSCITRSKKLKKQAEMNFIDKRIADFLILNYAEVHKTKKEH